MRYKITALIIALLISTTSYAYVIQGSATVPVMDGKIVNADTDARNMALLNALKNYFGKLNSLQPDKEIPDVTTEFFKFIKSYKIADRRYVKDTVSYTILADVDDVALNDLVYFVDNVVNTVVYNISGVKQDTNLDSQIHSALKEFKFDTKYESDFQANLQDDSSEAERKKVFLQSQSQYYLEISVIREPAAEGECTAVLTTKTFSKTKEFQTLKTKSSAKDDNDSVCFNTALTLSLMKTLDYVRGKFIPLPATEKVMRSYNIVAGHYDNFATPKKLMEELQKRSFISSYKIKNFAASKLDIEVQTYVDIDALIKKLQSIEAEYGFKATKGESNNISLDFTYQQE